MLIRRQAVMELSPQSLWNSQFNTATQGNLDLVKWLLASYFVSMGLSTFRLNALVTPRTQNLPLNVPRSHHHLSLP